MDIYSAVFELIDLRSFSNIWYWIALAAMWSTASRWIVGVPFDMIQRARAEGGRTEHDVATMIRINTDRMSFVLGQSGPWLVALAAFLLTMLAVTGFGYGVEVAQAVFFLAFPSIAVSALNVRTARRIRDRGATGETLYRMLFRHRIAVQVFGAAAILVTTIYGLSRELLIPGAFL